MRADNESEKIASINSEISRLELQLRHTTRPLTMGMSDHHVLGVAATDVNYNRILPAIKSKIESMPALDLIHFDDTVRKAEADAKANAYHAIKHLIMYSPRESPLKLATAESLTGGLIFSTLVDVPIGGVHKYGAFGVYDTEAKRTFLGVDAPDVYTHLCAHQMAVGVLRNSNASVAIAVTGNAMPLQGKSCNMDELKQLGEVFIGIAGYMVDGNIRVSTKVYNFCHSDYGGDSFAEAWFDTVVKETKLSELLISRQTDDETGQLADFSNLMDGYNQYINTALLSKFIRLQTTIQAFKDLCVFIQRGGNHVPAHIQRTEPASASLKLLRGQNRGNNAVINATKGIEIFVVNSGSIAPTTPRSDENNGCNCIDKFNAIVLPKHT